MNTTDSLRALDDQTLLAATRSLVHRDHALTAELLAHLGEIDARRLYLEQACASMFVYCTQVLGFSEGSAYLRIEVARAARRFPLILERIAEGANHLSGIALLARHMTEENHGAVLDESRGKTKRQIEEVAARLRPLPPIPDSVRKLPAPVAALLGEPAPRTAFSAPLPSRRPAAAISPTAPAEYKISFTASALTVMGRAIGS